jgi:ribonuclease P protein component
MLRRGRVMVPNIAVPSSVDQHTMAHDQPGSLSLRRARLRQSARFQSVRSQGKWWSHRLLAMGALANGLDMSRCGFSVSKRIGSAVERNRVRRRLPETVRIQWASVAPGWDVVFAAREPLRDADFDDIGKAVATLLQRSRLVGDPIQ